MGGFFYAAKSELADFQNVRKTSREQFERSGFSRPVTFETETYAIDYYPKIDYPAQDYVIFPNGNFVFAVGTFIYAGRIGADALKVFYQQTDYRKALLESHGHFLVVLRKAGQTYLFKDPIGTYELFLARDLKIATTSFLAATAVIGSCTINVQEIYEYVFNGVSLGNETVFEEIRRLSLFDEMSLEPQPTLRRSPYSLPPEEEPDSLQASVDRTLAGLSGYTELLTGLFADNIQMALSGGYDTRLLLALFRKAGITPHLFVYGRNGDEDVRTAKQIAEAETIPLTHIDKSTLRTVNLESYAEILQQNFHREDALPNGGIFNDGAELIARLRRSEAGALHVNGGGGEVYRNFFNLTQNRQLTPRQFVWVFYSQFDPAECTGVFDIRAYEDSVAEKVAAVFDGGKSQTLSRRQIEALYPYFRCRSWFGRENSINSRWGYSVLPFVDYRSVSAALRIPLRYKYFGNFEARLIRGADSALAKHSSNYGYSFSDNAPVSAAIGDYATYLRPPWMRRLTFRVRSRLGARPARPVLHSEPYLNRGIDVSFPHMSRYFRLNQSISDLHWARICTLEYLFRHVGAG